MDSGGDDQIGNKPTTGGERAARRSRCKQSSRRATTQREGQALQQLQHQMGKGTIAHGDMLHTHTNYKLPRMAYDDIRRIMQKRELQQKKGLLTDREVEVIVEKWRDDREMDELDPETVAKEVKRVEQKFKKYNVPMNRSMRVCVYTTRRMCRKGSQGSQDARNDEYQEEVWGKHNVWG